MRISRRKPLDSEERALVERAWDLTSPLRNTLRKRYPRLDVDGWAAELLCRYVPEFDEDLSKLSTWAIRIVRYVPSHAARQDRPRGFRKPGPRPVVVSFDDSMDWPASAPSGDTDVDSALATLSSLTPIAADLLIRRYVFGQSHAQMIADTGLSPNVVKCRIQRAVDKLRGTQRRRRAASHAG